MDDSKTCAKSFTRKQIFKAWWKAARPPFYIATLIPLFLGFIAAGKDSGHWNALIFCGALAVSFSLHLCANLANDLFDYLQGTDSETTIGGTGGLVSGAITLRQNKMALVALYALSIALTVIGVIITGLHGLWLIVAVAVFSSYFYVAPPIKYGYRALGEVFVFLNMGLVMVEGTYYALTGGLSAQVLAIALPVGLMVAGILYYQSLPEIQTDKAAGKITLAVLLGPERAIFLYWIWWPAVWLLMLSLWLCGVCAWPVLAGIVLCLPLHLKVCGLLRGALVEDFDWLAMDKYGWLVRLMYMTCGIGLVWGLAVN